MPEERRSPENERYSRGVGPGPYLARIVNHLDPSFMGTLEVTLLRDQGNEMGNDNQTFVARCASPFFGYTGFEYMGLNSAVNPKDPKKPTSTYEAYNDTQKSYGMWMVPPDVGVTVLVVFIDGDPSQGYWIGCIPSRFGNHMVPGIAGSDKLDIDKADKEKYGITSGPESLRVTNLPVAEMNRKLNAKAQEIDVEKIPKAVHPMADRFLEQGLLFDDVRGVTTSSARREAPSMVFGISTPGPLDKRINSKRGVIGTTEAASPTPVPVSRLGGTQFVMDDGDERYIRATTASKGPVKYIDVQENKDKAPEGDPTIPYNEYFRVRTRTGHQLLFHNSEDLIYIANARGTAWIELTSNGKIDVFATDSISIHTENDLNIRADRDINLEAGRNFNIRTENGRLHADIATNLEFLVNADAQITVGSNYDLLVGGSTKISTHVDFDLATNGDNKITCGGNTSIGSGGDHKETAATINMNSTKPAEPALVAAQVNPLELRENVATSTVKPWSSSRYLAGTLDSIMKRVPMHEPWAQHENQAPDLVDPTNTDRES